MGDKILFWTFETPLNIQQNRRRYCRCQSLAPTMLGLATLIMFLCTYLDISLLLPPMSSPPFSLVGHPPT